jgi:carbon starvation protein CstA
VSEEFYQLSKLKTEFIVQLRNRTITAILVISVAYMLTLIFISVILITSKTIYCIFTLVIPLFMYLWLSTYAGIKHVNNHYKFKQTSEGILLYKKKRRENYSTIMLVWALIFLISSIIRLICEISNLKIINTELISRSK